MSQIVLENISKTYTIDGIRINAVDNVSLRIEKGDFVSIVGHSGSGKTSLLSMIGGILGPSAGKIFFEGRDIYSLDSDGLSEYRCKKIGFMFQFASLLPVLTAKENILLPFTFRPDAPARTGAGEERKAEELLKMVDLTDKATAYPSHLSGGQQRRVAIARAFMNDPAVILADEPTGDLDEETEADMMEFFKKMNRERSITFIMVTHNTDLAKQASRSFRMTNGVIRAE